MLPSEASTPMGDAQPLPPSLFRSGGPMQPPRPHYNIVNHSYGNGQSGGMDVGGAESDQLPMQSFSNNNLNNQSQQQFRSVHGVGGISAGKLESQVNNDQQLQSMRPQQLQSMRNQSPHSEQSLFMQQQQQLQIRQSHINMLQQHRLQQLQQEQRPQMQQQFQGQNLPLRSPVKTVHGAGACATRLTQYIYQQRNRPEDNNIEFWRKFVAEFFAPNSVKKWCVSMYGSGRQTTGVFPQDAWHCEICNHKPGRGFEATYEVLPRLFKIKYESGTLEELLCIDVPREYHNPSGQIVLDYAKAVQQSVFEQLRVVRDGQLRIIFSPDLKICSWEFCSRHHEEVISRRLFMPQVSRLGAATQNYQNVIQNASSNPSVSDLQGNCNMFVAPAKFLAKAVEAPSVNDLGYSKRYVRCLQISEVVNSMKDLIDYSRVTGTGPIESLAKFPRRNASSGLQAQSQPSEDQQQLQQQKNMLQNSNTEQPSTSQNAGMQPSNNSVSPVNISMHHQQQQQQQQQNFAHTSNGNLTDTQGSAEKNGHVGMSNDMKNVNVNGAISLISNGMKNGNPGLRFSGVRSAMGGNNQIPMNGRVGAASVDQDRGMIHHQQQDLSNQLSGFGSTNGFNNLQFDWKPSP